MASDENLDAPQPRSASPSHVAASHSCEAPDCCGVYVEPGLESSGWADTRSADYGDHRRRCGRLARSKGGGKKRARACSLPFVCPSTTNLAPLRVTRLPDVSKMAWPVVAPPRRRCTDASEFLEQSGEDDRAAWLLCLTRKRTGNASKANRQSTILPSRRGEKSSI